MRADRGEFRKGEVTTEKIRTGRRGGSGLQKIRSIQSGSIDRKNVY